MSVVQRLLVLVAALCLALPAWAKVDANTASVDELQTVTGIGPTLAQRIVDERRKGPYKNLADLEARVKGIGESNVRKMSAGGLTVDHGSSSSRAGASSSGAARAGAAGAAPQAAGAPPAAARSGSTKP
jgi:competence protein ComEA